MFMSFLSGRISSVTALLTAGMKAMKRSVPSSAVPLLMNSNVGTPPSVSPVRSSAMESQTAVQARTKIVRIVQQTGLSSAATQPSVSQNATFVTADALTVRTDRTKISRIALIEQRLQQNVK